MTVVEIIVGAFLGVITLFAIYLLFVVMPVVMYAEAKCLSSGYPKAHVTIGLETYCSTLDGAVTVKVDKLK